MEFAEFKELIGKYAKEVYQSNYTPDRALQILGELASLEGNVIDFANKCELAYNLRLQKCYEAEEKANRAKLMANTSPEYKAYLEAKALLKLVSGLQSSLKYFARAKEEEKRNARFQ